MTPDTPDITPHVNEDRLVDLIANLLDDASKSAVLGHLSVCALCDEHLRLLVREHEALRTRPAPRISGGQIVLPSYETAQTVPFRRRRIRWVGAGLAVAAAAAFLLPHLFRPEVSGADSYWLPRADREALESVGSPDAVSKLQRALAAYDSHDPERALALMENIQIPAENGRAKAIRQVYEASALVNTQRLNEAREVMSGVDMTSLPREWRERANWIRYLSIKGGAPDDNSRALLQRLSGSPGDIGRMAREERSRLAGD